MKNVLSYIGVSAAALILFGTQSIQAQEAAKANIPFSFHSKIAAYESGTYTVETQHGNVSPLVLINDDTRKATFVPAVSSLEPTAKTDARGPVMSSSVDKALASCLKSGQPLGATRSLIRRYLTKRRRQLVSLLSSEPPVNRYTAEIRIVPEPKKRACPKRASPLSAVGFYAEGVGSDCPSNGG